MEPVVNSHALVNGTRIAHGVYGDGIPLVLMHGTPSSSLIWRKVIPALVNNGFRVHVFDLLGYGLSERPWSQAIDTSISGQVDILKGMLNVWGLDTFHLIAHDIGGGIAQRFGVFFTERLRSLTLIDVVSFDSYPSERTRQQMEHGLDKLLTAPDSEHRAHFREWLKTAVVNTQEFERGPLDTYLDYISGPVGQGSLFQHQISHYDPRHTLDIAERLSELGDIPVKIIWGEGDTWQVPAWASKLSVAIPDSDMTFIENAGHFSPEDAPETVASLISDFVSGVEKPFGTRHIL